MSYPGSKYKGRAKRIKKAISLLDIVITEPIGRSELRLKTSKHYQRNMSYLEAFDQLEHLIRTNQKDTLQNIISLDVKKRKSKSSQKVNIQNWLIV